jgi:small GTP-binding protein
MTGIQLQSWGVSWVWGPIAILILGWRWLLAYSTRPDNVALEQNLAEVRAELQTTFNENAQRVSSEQVEAVLQNVIDASKEDLPIWEDWPAFVQHSQVLVRDIAFLYHPEVKYPLLNIYVPQAYELVRGTVDDLDRWMRVTAPALNQVTVAQVYQTYKTYRSIETPLRQVGVVLNLSRWLWNPIAAAAKQVSRPLGNRASQQLLANFSQILRETALTILCRQAIALYGGQASLNLERSVTTLPQSQTLRELIEQAEPAEQVASKPLSLLIVGRTGAGKSSLINTLFQDERAEVDVLPSTDQITSYRWETSPQEALILWDSPGYEQIDRTDLRSQVLAQATKSDLLLLVTPALDPALESDLALLQDIAEQRQDIPIFLVITQVDRLRPVREWTPPYDWQQGDRLKERNIRQAVMYRQEQAGEQVQTVLPIVTASDTDNREGWGWRELSVQLVEAISPAKSHRLAQSLRSREARIRAASLVIERYALQMTASQGSVSLIKTPLFAFIAARFAGTPDLGGLLAQHIPAEQIPAVINKVMMTHELASLFSQQENLLRAGEIVKLWPVLSVSNEHSPAHNAWAWGQTLTEYWTQDLSAEDLVNRFNFYLNRQVETLAQVYKNQH